MNGSLKGLIFALLFLPEAVFGTTNAAVHLFCFSLRFHAATTNSFTLALSTAPSSAPANGELAPVFDPRLPNHGSGFLLHDPQLGSDITGVIFFDAPPFSDANTNGFDDFFEVSQGVPTRATLGYFDSQADSGNVTAIWSRAAGSATGICQLHLEAMTYGDLGVFTHTFEVLEYTGPLNYTPGSNTVAGTIALLQTGTPANTLTGAVAFVKVATNRFNELILQPGTWTNSAAQTLAYTNSLIQRDQSLGTNYYGVVSFADGDPGTPEPDYFLWMLSVDDSNDSNHNGVPDFSDDPLAAVRQPRLALTPAGGNLLLSLSGDVGRLLQVQRAPGLNPAGWTNVLSVTLTNDPQSVPLPWPTNGASFWRVVAP